LRDTSPLQAARQVKAVVRRPDPRCSEVIYDEYRASTIASDGEGLILHERSLTGGRGRF
jgi:hypothetical protein